MEHVTYNSCFRASLRLFPANLGTVSDEHREVLEREMVRSNAYGFFLVDSSCKSYRKHEV